MNKVGSDSDIDLQVAFSEDAEPSLFDLVHMQGELESIFGRKVDLVSRRGLESSRNYLRREAILRTAETVYAA
ncbi:MAG: nucleotidyltransferase family protein [Candidatus Sumerlaeia bacterium]